MKLKQLIRPQRQRRVRSAFVITEFDFVYSRGESLNDSANLAAQKAMVSDVFE